MDFEEYMESQIPGYKDLISPEQIDDLKKDYDMAEQFNKSVQFALKRQGNSTGIDYTNDYEKNMANMVKYSKSFSDKISFIKLQLGIVDEEEKKDSLK